MWEKEKYFSKLLSESALMVNLERVYDTSGMFATFVWILSSVFSNLSIFLLSTFGLYPDDFEQLSLTFDVLETDVNDIMQGIWVDFSKYLSEEISDILNWIKQNIQEQFQAGFMDLLNRKGKYDYSYYDKSYYDPTVLRDFLVSSWQGLFKKHPIKTSFKKDTETVQKTQDVIPPIAEYVYNKFMHVTNSLKYNFVLGYGILGFSFLGKGYTPTITWNETLYELPSERLEYLHNALILGLTPLGYGFLQYPDGYYVLPSPPIIKFLSKLASNTMNRYSLTQWGFLNYVRPDEMKTYQKCERADQYMSLQLIRYHLEGIVENVLRNEGLTVIEMRQYKNAVNQLVALRTKRHKWGYKAFKEMDINQLHDWWIEYWVRKGLNRTLLERLWGVIGKWLPQIEQTKFNLQSYLRKKRRELAKLGVKTY